MHDLHPNAIMLLATAHPEQWSPSFVSGFDSTTVSTGHGFHQDRAKHGTRGYLRGEGLHVKKRGMERKLSSTWLAMHDVVARESRGFRPTAGARVLSIVAALSFCWMHRRVSSLSLPSSHDRYMWHRRHARDTNVGGENCVSSSLSIEIKEDRSEEVIDRIDLEIPIRDWGSAVVSTPSRCYQV